MATPPKRGGIRGDLNTPLMGGASF